MHILLTLLAVIIPIVLIEAPNLVSNIDMGISGTYDVLVFSFLIPRTDILPLLPSSLRLEENLLAVPSDVLNKLSKTIDEDVPMHPVLLQMGYQINTGPGPDWLPKMSFNEMKLEIPYIRHFNRKSNEALTLKQYMIFSNTLIKLGSQGSGLRSTTAHFTPTGSPSNSPADSKEIEYIAAPFLKAKATRASSEDSSSWDIIKPMMESWWYGQGTGDTLQKFDFDWDNAPIKPTAYDLQIDLDLSAFAERDSKSTLSKVQVGGVGWRTKVKVSSISRKVGQ